MYCLSGGVVSCGGGDGVNFFKVFVFWSFSESL